MILYFWIINFKRNEVFKLDNSSKQLKLFISIFITVVNGICGSLQLINILLSLLICTTLIFIHKAFYNEKDNQIAFSNITIHELHIFVIFLNVFAIFFIILNALILFSSWAT